MTRLKVLVVLLVLCQLATAQTRREVNLKTWEFSRDKTTWTQVDIPHDWAIAGPFDKKWDLQRVAIEQNGETEATEKSGRSGALPWIGEGWYRTSVDVPAGYEVLDIVDRKSLVDIASRAGILASLVAYASAYGGEGIHFLY